MDKFADLTLTEELYELSGWGMAISEDEYGTWFDTEDLPAWQKGSLVGDEFYHAKEPTTLPAYGVGFLLRKLPMQIENNDTLYHFSLCEGGADDSWQAEYRSPDDGQFVAEVAATPEDALAKVAIELFKRKVFAK